MPKQLSPGQIDALDEMLRRGKLTGERAEAARELVRRYRQKNEPGMLESAVETGFAAANSLLDTATLGLAGKAQSAIAAGVAKLSGDERSLGDLFVAADKVRQARDERLSAEHPYASTAGSVAGAFAGGAAAAKTAARLGLKTARTLTGRAAQYAAGGGAASAAEQVIREGEVNGNTLAAGVTGAVVGGVTGPAAEKFVSAAAPTVSRAWRKLAAKLQTPVEDMAAFIDDTFRATGHMPSVAQAIHARDQGLLRGWAERHNTFGTAIDEAARAAPSQDLSAGKLRRVRNEQMDAAMGSIRDRTVRLDPSLFDPDDAGPHIATALAGPKMKDIRLKIAGNEPLTVGDVDRIRQKLRGLQQSEPGGPFGDIADALTEMATSQVPEYGDALERFGRQSKFTEGFETGMSGKSLPEVEDTIRTAEGRAGHKAGALTRQGQKALRTMAPSVPPSAGGMAGVEELARGASHIAVGGRALGTFHVLRGMMDMLPEAYQRELAAGLLTRDPARIQKTLGQLRQAGADLQDIRRLAGGLATMMGAQTGAAASGGEQ